MAALRRGERDLGARVLEDVVRCGGFLQPEATLLAGVCRLAREVRTIKIFTFSSFDFETGPGEAEKPACPRDSFHLTVGYKHLHISVGETYQVFGNGLVFGLFITASNVLLSG